MNSTKITKTRLFTIGLILLSISLVSCDQSRQEKTETIINKLNLIENTKSNYEFQLEPIKYQATGNDSIKVIELEKQLTDEEVRKKISSAFKEAFSNSEINDMYNFIQTSAYDKFFNSKETYKIIYSKFKEIDVEIERITKDFSKIVEKPIKKFEPIPIDRENGIYATVDYDFVVTDKDVKWEKNPSITAKDMKEIKKTVSEYNGRLEISIVFTKKGANKFYLLTKGNIGKPLAFIVAKHIVTMPTVNSEIIGGKASISGDFSEEEIDKMIETLLGK